jgi:hypothetical protein
MRSASSRAASLASPWSFAARNASMASRSSGWSPRLGIGAISSARPAAVSSSRTGPDVGMATSSVQIKRHPWSRTARAAASLAIAAAVEPIGCCQVRSRRGSPRSRSTWSASLHQVAPTDLDDPAAMQLADTGNEGRCPTQAEGLPSAVGSAGPRRLAPARTSGIEHAVDVEQPHRSSHPTPSYTTYRQHRPSTAARPSPLPGTDRPSPCRPRNAQIERVARPWTWAW